MGHLLSIPRVAYRDPSPKSKGTGPFFMRRPRPHGHARAGQGTDVEPRVLPSTEGEFSEPGSSGTRSTDSQLTPSMISGPSSCDIRYLEKRARDLSRMTKRVREELEMAKEAREKARGGRGGSLRSSYTSRGTERESNPSSLCSTRARHDGMRGNKPSIRHMSVNNRAFS